MNDLFLEFILLNNHSHIKPDKRVPEHTHIYIIENPSDIMSDNIAAIHIRKQKYEMSWGIRILKLYLHKSNLKSPSFTWQLNK